MPVYGGHYDINLEDDLGNGTFGVLYKGSDTRNGRNVAAKKTFVKRSKAKEMAQAEIRALKHIGSHPNVIQLYDSFTERDNIWMMLEYCNLGDLETYCEQNKLNASEVGDIVLQAATAVEFLHSRSPAVIHRDIKPANILLHRKDGEYIIIKLGDYGLSQIAEDDQPVDISFWYSDVGTLGYKAPEIYDKKKYTVAIDVFSLGTVVYALVLYCDNKIQYLQPMIDGKCPGQKMLETSTDLELEEIHHKDLYKYADIIKGMTKFDPAKRTAIEQVVVQFETLAENELYAAETVLQAGQEWETINLCFHEESIREGKTQELNGEDNLCLLQDDECHYDLDEMKTRLITKNEDVVNKLLEVADILDEQCRDVRIARTSFAAAGIVGGGLAIGGIVASFFTFGASLALTGVGVGISVASGAGSVATIIADKVIGDKRVASAQETVNDYHKLFNEYLALKLSVDDTQDKELDCYDPDSPVPIAAAASSAAAMGVTGGAVIGEAVTAGETVAAASTSTFQVLGVGAKVAAVGGAAFAGIGVAVNIGELVYNSIHIHKQTPSETANVLREQAAEKYKTHKYLY